MMRGNQPLQIANHPVAENDLALAAAVANGDEAAKRKLVARLFDRTRKKVGYLVGNDRDADDMTQTALVQILHSAGTYSGICAIESWADRITIRTVMRFLRRRKRSQKVESDSIDAGLKRSHQPDGAEDFWIRQRLRVLLQRLSAKHRVVILLRYSDGYSVDEIAEIVDAPTNTVRARLRKGRKQMKKWIIDDPTLEVFINGRNL